MFGTGWEELYDEKTPDEHGAKFENSAERIKVKHVEERSDGSVENDEDTELVLFEEMEVEACYEREHYGVAEYEEFCDETEPDKPKTDISDEEKDSLIKNKNEVNMGNEASIVSGNVPEDKHEKSELS